MSRFTEVGVCILKIAFLFNMPKRLTQKDFESRAILIHNGKYDYSKVMYTNSYTDVCIICPIHGEFWQEPHSHLRGCGCSKCSKDRQKKQYAV